MDVGLFSQSDTSGWEIRKYSGTTDYALTLFDGKQVLLADSRQSASAFYKNINVDLDKTPILHWSWLTVGPINPGDELKKQGDDFVARISVINNGGLFLGTTRTFIYV